MKDKENKGKTALDRVLQSQQPSKQDPNGSYTGRPENKGETPVQDADDL